jgi:hypothetical protein
MDHIIWLDAESKELENLINGNKSMIIRGADDKKVLREAIEEGDIFFMISKPGENRVTARGKVTSVYYSGELSIEESFEMIIRNQDKLQLPDHQFENCAGKKYLILIQFGEIEQITPFRIEKDNSNTECDLLPAAKIFERIKGI